MTMNMPGDPENLSIEKGGLPPPGLPPQTAAPEAAPRDVWRPRDLLLFVAFIPFALLVSKLAVLMGFVVVRPFAGWHAKTEVVQSNTIFLLVEQCFFYVLMVGFLFLLAKFQHQHPFWKSLGWKKLAAGQAMGYLLAGGTLAIVVNLVLWIQPDEQGFPLEKLFDSRLASYAIGAFAIVVAPVVEELVFRGLLFAVLEHAVGIPSAVVTTAVLFAGLHIPEYWHAWNHMLMILFVGLVFSLARGLSGALTPSIFLHIGYNSLMMAGLFVSTQHFRTAHAMFALW